MNISSISSLIYLQVLGLHDVDGEPGYGGVEADREQDLGQVRLDRVHVALKVRGQILKGNKINMFEMQKLRLKSSA